MTGDGVLKFDIQSLSDTVSALRTATAKIDGLLRGLDREVAQLRGQWTGAANDAYDDAHSRWSAEIGQINEVLARTAADLAAAQGRYRDAEKLNASRWPL